MKTLVKNYATVLILLISVILISCDSSVNVNTDGSPGGDFPGMDGDFGFCDDSDRAFQAEEQFFDEVPAASRIRLRLEGIGGDVNITGVPDIVVTAGIGDPDVVTVTATKHVRSDSAQDAEDQLQELEVNVQSTENEVFVETVQPLNTGCRMYDVDYTITLPEDFEVRVTNLAGVVTIDSMDNDVSVTNTTGDVVLNGIVGDAIVTLFTGNIESEVTLPLNGTIEMDTFIGDINLDIPVNTSADFSAMVTDGSIDVVNLTLQDEVSSSDSVSGTLGSGEGLITLESEFGGDINVTGF